MVVDVTLVWIRVMVLRVIVIFIRVAGRMMGGSDKDDDGGV